MINPTIASLIEKSCQSKADEVFLVDDNQCLTGELLWKLICSVVTWLNKKGLKKGDVVAFYCTSSIPHAVTFFACLVCGVVPCCLHVRETNERNKKSINFVNAKYLFTDQVLFEQARNLIEDDVVIVLSPEFFEGKENKFKTDHIDWNDLALILISSGTTGEPKCISHNQRTLAATAEYGPHSYNCWSNTDSTIIVMAPSFAAWVHTVLPFIFIQGRIVFSSQFDPATFLKTLEVEKITLAPLVPTAWRMVLAGKPKNYDLSHLKTIFFSGEPGSESLVKDLQDKIGPNVMTSYLASEGGCASGVVADSNILSVEGQASSTGYVVKDAEVKIINPEGDFEEKIRVGEVGEIVLKSASVALGYFANPALSQKKFLNGWWRSGDLGVIEENGLLYVKGRLDNQINTGGIKIHAEEVEACLLQHPYIQAAAVVGIPDDKWGQKIIAHIVSNYSGMNAEEIVNFCLINELLPKAHLPKEFYFHDKLPVGPTGKLYRRGLSA
nr:long-chain fatty acid--CoA ligase [Rhodospirillales bacterium]